jgi:hypothetical protein
MTRSAKTGRPVEEHLKENVRLSLTGLQGAETKLRDLLSVMSKTPKLMAMTPKELAETAGVTEEIAHAGLATVRTLPIPKWMADTLGLKEPVLYVDASLLNDLLPPIYAAQVSQSVTSFEQGKGPLGKILLRRQIVAHYLQKLEEEKRPYLRAASPATSSVTAMGPKGLR